MHRLTGLTVKSISLPRPAARARARCLRSIAVAALLLNTAVIPCVASQLVLLAAKPEGGEFRFSPGPVESVAQTPRQRSNSVLSGHTAHYTLLLDWNEIDSTDYGYFRYPFYVRRSREGASGECDAASECRSYLMKGTPIGSFQDQQIEVPFAIGAGEEGSILIPVFSFSYPSFLSGPTWAKSQEVLLSSGGEIHIPLTNKANLPVSVSFHPRVSREITGRIRSCYSRGRTRT